MDNTGGICLRESSTNATVSLSASAGGSNAVCGLLKAVVIAIFFASGVASLILQVVWLKQLQFVLGSATFSVSVTVASFFFGLSLGSAIGGRLADTVIRP